MVRFVAALLAVLLVVPTASAQSFVNPSDAVADAHSLDRIRLGLAAKRGSTLALDVAALPLPQQSLSQWQAEYDQAKTNRRKANTIMIIGAGIAGISALAAASTGLSMGKGQRVFIGSLPGLGIATWGYLARRKGDREIARLEAAKPSATSKSPSTAR
jgi:hypothetical protein